MENKQVIKQVGLYGVPTVHFFYKGLLVDHMSGLHSKRSFRERIEAALRDWSSLTEEEAADRMDQLLREEEPGMVYPISRLSAPGRLLIPVHWSDLVQPSRKRADVQEGLTSEAVLNSFIDSDSCLSEGRGPFHHVLRSLFLSPLIQLAPSTLSSPSSLSSPPPHINSTCSISSDQSHVATSHVAVQQGELPAGAWGAYELREGQEGSCRADYRRGDELAVRQLQDDSLLTAQHR